MAIKHSIKVLVLSKRDSLHRNRLKKVLQEDYKLTFISEIDQVEDSVKTLDPDVFIHDWDYELHEKTEGFTLE